MSKARAMAFLLPGRDLVILFLQARVQISLSSVQQTVWTAHTALPTVLRSQKQALTMVLLQVCMLICILSLELATSVF